ncbi:hypothetical protein SEA_LILMARTIN_272 [Streptomyces phage LilMartin]|nr:hypothetical protein SEA_LILMARTIN_20 [Streptomyces phage LilMartin]QNO12445.1 hypothetical protein SEA_MULCHMANSION_20 [Streptomyces phage MulchMansion]UVK61332.1 hypothetical protein SEA_ANGELA_20 [Streptomyces phage Angela]QNN98480.1 hypothetical protein SEA_LILMARTIN_272 [Streptomyces phage LilMartin]QNO12659.1 hypothetical protein SEA_MULCHMANSION_276 [Streptomyces phage MulchMansion]
MLRKKKAPRRTHSGSLILERAGLRTESGVISTSEFPNMIVRFRESGMTPIGARHSKHCLCGDGNNEIVPF